MKWLLSVVLIAKGSLGFFNQGYAQHTQDGEKGLVFVVNAPVNDLSNFERIVESATPLKSFGTVRVNISTLADKSFHEIPEEGSSWHEYASSNPTPSKFFPDKLVAPFIPVDFVKKNRELLLAKAAILRKHQVEGAFLGYEPNFLPEEFFEAHPAMLGPRVDHPRRSTQKAFAPSVCAAETRNMYSRMMSDMLTHVPEITMFGFKTNDAGAGIDWSDWLYSGANGPAGCRGYSAGQRMKMLLESYQSGASAAGKPLSIYVDDKNSNYSEAEKRDIEQHMPPHCFFSGGDKRKIYTVGSLLNTTYPVQGLIDPVAVVKQVLEIKQQQAATVYLNFRAAYDRGCDTPETIALTIGIMEAALKAKANQDEQATLDSVLDEVALNWGGTQDALSLKRAFTAMNEAFAYKSTTIPRISSLYWGVTMRLVNRPLLFDPALITAAEESYFLPYVFSISKEDARHDYVDLHGARVFVPPAGAFGFAERADRVAHTFEGVGSQAAQKTYLNNMALGLRIYAKILESCANFIYAQEIRDRAADVLNGSEVVIGKVATWEGHPDYIRFNEIMRNEYDNALGLIQLMEKGGEQLVIKARHQGYEDSFLLGPDFTEQLKTKRKIMWKHWQDIENYLASPLK
ncbi:hypothetical protein [Sphingobacterium pedocola]|nr:hypothetical protein [Sphingobacterium pedocola]